MKRNHVLLLIALLLILLGDLIAWRIQTNHGEVVIKDLRFIGSNGMLMSGLLYVQKA